MYSTQHTGQHTSTSQIIPSCWSTNCNHGTTGALAKLHPPSRCGMPKSSRQGVTQMLDKKREHPTVRMTPTSKTASEQQHIHSISGQVKWRHRRPPGSRPLPARGSHRDNISRDAAGSRTLVHISPSSNSTCMHPPTSTAAGAGCPLLPTDDRLFPEHSKVWVPTASAGQYWCMLGYCPYWPCHCVWAAGWPPAVCP